MCKNKYSNFFFSNFFYLFVLIWLLISWKCTITKKKKIIIITKEFTVFVLLLFLLIRLNNHSGIMCNNFTRIFLSYHIRLMFILLLKDWSATLYFILLIESGRQNGMMICFLFFLLFLSLFIFLLLNLNERIINKNY